MRMAGAPHVLAAGSVLDRQRALRDHLPRIRAHDVDAEDTIRLGVGDEFDHALGLEVRLRAGVCAEGEGADFVLDALGFELGFVLADPGDLRVRVHDAGDGVVVDVTVASGDVFDAGDGFFLGFVREHGAEGAVAYYPDVGEFGPVLFVDYEAAFVVDLQADVLEPEPGCVGAAANGYEDDVCVQCFFFSAFRGFDFETNARAAGVTFEDFGIEFEFHALLFENLFGGFGDVSVHSWTTNLAEEFDDCDF